MALELKISAGNAKQVLDDVTAAAKNLKTELDKFPQATRFTNLVNAFNGLTGIPPAAISSIAQLNQVLNQLGSVKDLGTLASNLKRVGNIDVSRVTSNIRQLTTSLALLRVPPGLNQITAALTLFNASASSASASARSLNSAFSSINTPRGITNLNAQLGNTHASFRMASSGVDMFGGSLRTVNGILGGFGITLGAVGIGRVIQDIYKVNTSFEQFGAAMQFSTGSAEGAGKQLEYIKGVASRLALPILDATASYRRLAQSVTAAGQPIARAQVLFEQFGTAARVLNLSSEQTSRVFLALSQMIGKGTVSMEELKQQMGEAFPAMELMAQATGHSVQEFAKLVANGKIGTDAVDKLGAKIVEVYGKGVPAALQTTQARMALLSNALVYAEQSFGKGFFDGFTKSLDSLTSALNSTDFQKTLGELGAAMGHLAAQGVHAAVWLTENWQLVGAVVGGVVATKIGIALTTMVNGFTAMAAGTAPAVGVMGAFANAAGVLGPVLVGLASTVAGLAARFAMLLMANPILAGIAVAVAALGSTFYLAGQYAGYWGTEVTNAAISAQNLYQAATAVSGAVDTVGEALFIAGAGAKEYAGDTRALIAAQEVFAAEIGTIEARIAMLTQQFAENGDKTGELSKQIQELTDKYGQLVKAQADVAKMQADAAKGNVEYAASASEAATASGAIASSTDDAAKAYNKSAGSARSAAQANREYAAATRDASRETAQFEQELEQAYQASQRASAITSSTQSVTVTDNGGGGGGGHEFSNNLLGDLLHNDLISSFFSGGGISTQGKNRGRVPASAFINAPHFDGGGVIGPNGIPAVLHPNEAVVPLTGGGAIPIAGGGDPNTSVLIGTITQLMNIALSTQTEVARVKEAVHANTSVLKSAIDKVNLSVQSLVTLGTYGGGSSGGSRGSSGSSSLGGSNGVLTDLAEFTAKAQELSNTLSAANQKTADIWNTASKFYYGTGRGGVNPGSFANQSDKANYESAQRASSAAQSDLYKFLNSNPTLAAQYYRNLAATASSSGSGITAVAPKDYYNRLADQYAAGKIPNGGTGFHAFATGSPNAYRDATGGFTATLHPDEAVIPLPDGRSVPVSFPSEVSSLMQSMADEYRSGGGTSVAYGSGGASPAARGYSAGGWSVNVNMHINATDAASFAKSKTQIMQEFKSEFDRVAQRYSAAERREDPTRRQKR